MTASWFEELMGFPEGSYQETKRNLEVVGETLRSRVNDRTYAIGELETRSLGELRHHAASMVSQLPGRLRVSTVVGDVGRLHRASATKNALFQVASQFNLLEMAGPDVTPEDGVTRYVYDHTQGPACALAAGPATIYRNYCAPVDGHAGQTRDRQLDCLRDLGTALGNRSGTLWTMRNGYALCTAEDWPRSVGYSRIVPPRSATRSATSCAWAFTGACRSRALRETTSSCRRHSALPSR